MNAASGQRGSALVSVVASLVVLTLLAWAFVALINTEHRLAGEAYRATAAVHLADAGTESVLWHLQHRAQADAENGAWLQAGHAEALGGGRFMVEGVEEQPSGLVVITARGEVGGTVRRVRRIARIVPRALGFGLFGRDLVFAGRARTYVVPAPTRPGSRERLGDVAAQRQVWLDRDVSLNALEGRMVPLRDGAIQDYALFGLAGRPDRSDGLQEALPDIVLAEEARVIVGTREWLLTDLWTISREAPGVWVRALRRAETSAPTADLDAYQALAEQNGANQAINREVGEHWRDRQLRTKRDSLYTAEQFRRILDHLDARAREGDTLKLAGVVFVEGAVTIERALRIDDGALVVRGDIRVADRARLEVRHAGGASSLQGVIASGDGGRIHVGHDGALIADGLVMASVGVAVQAGQVDVWGAVVAGQGFFNRDGLVVIRYHAGVMATPGLSRTAYVMVRPLGWQELP